IVNQSVPLALSRLGYSDSEVQAILTYTLGTLRFDEGPARVAINRESLRKHGVNETMIRAIEERLPSVFELSQAFTRWNLGEVLLKELNIPAEKYEASNFNLLNH